SDAHTSRTRIRSSGPRSERSACVLPLPYPRWRRQPERRHDPNLYRTSALGKVDNTIGETLRFALLLARKGSLRITPPDYSRRHAHTLEEIPRSVFDPGAVLPNRRPDSIRTKLLSVPFIRLVAGNLTFLRNPEKSYAQFFVSDEQKLAYIRILKCGSTSVLRSFLPLVHKPFENYPLKASSI